MARGVGDAVIQIAAESSLLDLRQDVAICGADQAELSLLPGVSTDTLEGSLLHHAEELRLQAEWELPNLVEEQRASVRHRKRAIAWSGSARVGAPLVAEELAPRKLGNDSGAIHHDESFLFGRASSAWMSCAASSFPVPLSPSMSTDPSVNFAISTIRRRAEVHARLLPIRFFSTKLDRRIWSTAAQRSRRATIRRAVIAAPSQTTTSAAPARSSVQNAVAVQPFLR